MTYNHAKQAQVNQYILCKIQKYTTICNVELNFQYKFFSMLKNFITILCIEDVLNRFSSTIPKKGTSFHLKAFSLVPLALDFNKINLYIRYTYIVFPKQRFRYSPAVTKTEPINDT